MDRWRKKKKGYSLNDVDRIKNRKEKDRLK